MTATTTLRGFRLHLGLLGRRNVGKSSLINALMDQTVSIVSPTPGTTTDPVTKPMELQPIGPVLLIDTAGIDDPGELGSLRVKRTKQMLDRCDVGIIVVAGNSWGDEEENLLSELQKRSLPTIVAFNMCDREQPDSNLLAKLEKYGITCVHCSALTGQGLDKLREAIIATAPNRVQKRPSMLGNLVSQNDIVVLVIPIDKEAPVGRLIMPQVNAIRDSLDKSTICIVVKTTELAHALSCLKSPPALVVTDSQAFSEVSKIVPEDVPLTGFSVLMARIRGDYELLKDGASVIDQLQPGDKVLVAEACSHHPVEDDIGRVKIPRWLNEHVGGALDFQTVSGHDFPEDLTSFKLVIHCGACTMNRREVISRLDRCRELNIPVTNYGMLIAKCTGVLERVTIR